jgi:hypothetical protein
LAESVGSTVDAIDVDAEAFSHTGTAVVGRTAAVGGKREKKEDGNGVGFELREPSVVQ